MSALHKLAPALLVLVLAGCPRLTSVPDSGVRLVFEPAPGARVDSKALLRMQAVFDKRLEQLEVRGARVSADPKTNRISVDIPGGKPGPAKRLLGRMGRLELREMPDEKTNFLDDLQDKLPEGIEFQKRMNHKGPDGEVVHVRYLAARDASTLGRFVATLGDRLPAGTELLLKRDSQDPTGRYQFKTCLVAREAALTGDYVTDASVQIDNNMGTPFVMIELDDKGAKIFEDLTARSIKKRIAIVVDGKVSSAPVVQSKIPGGRLHITMGYGQGPEKSRREAEDLAVAFRTGALPFPVVLAEETVYGPATKGKR